MSARKKPPVGVVGIVVRPGSPEVSDRGRNLAEWLAARDVKVVGHAGWAEEGGAFELADRRTMLAQVDLVVVLGGDGSLLGVARLAGESSAPVLGIHHGEFGFLTASDRGDIDATMEKVLGGSFTVSERGMLSVIVKRGDEVTFESKALNDAVITQGTVSRIIELNASADGQHLAVYKGDGLILATPTGSTAYSLSAGGPVVDPSMQAIIVTPISPHTLSVRPLVLPDSAEIDLRLSEATEEAVLTLDGQEWRTIEPGDRVVVTKSSHRASIADVDGHGFFEVLRSKLHWGARGDKK